MPGSDVFTDMLGFVDDTPAIAKGKVITQVPHKPIMPYTFEVTLPSDTWNQFIFDRKCESVDEHDHPFSGPADRCRCR